ncbi:MAG: EpsI family protein [candidate division KSB1 bacterium]|nr:EpsI family protein [candidate division KSB1 bacterium]
MNWKSREYGIVVVLFLVTGIYVNLLRYSRVPVREQVDLTTIPMSFGQWQAQSFSLDQRTLEILKADQILWRKYSNSRGQTIWLFVAYFKDQKYGEQIHSPRHCLPGGGWKIMDKKPAAIQVHGSPPQQLNMNKLVNSNGRYTELMFYWFWTRRGTLTSEYGLKLDLAKNALLRQPTDAAFIRIHLPLEEPSETLASEFIAEIFPAIKNALPFN